MSAWHAAVEPHAGPDQGARRTVGGATRRRYRLFGTIAALVVVVVVILYAALLWFVVTATTHATRVPVVGSPADEGLAYEPLTFTSDPDRLTLSGWLLPSTSKRAIIMVHGLDSNRWKSNGTYPDIAALYVHAGFNVFLFDLRSQGESGGTRLGFAWDERQDVRGAVDFLRSRGFPPGEIGIYGTSYGAAVSLLAAATVPDIGAVVADSAFADVRDMSSAEVRRRTGLPLAFLPGLTLAARTMYGIDLAEAEPVQMVSRIAPRPILFIHERGDPRIPVDNSIRLQAAARNPSDELWIVNGTTHGQAYFVDPAAYSAKVLAFFNRSM